MHNRCSLYNPTEPQVSAIKQIGWLRRKAPHWDTRALKRNKTPGDDERGVDEACGGAGDGTCGELTTRRGVVDAYYDLCDDTTNTIITTNEDPCPETTRVMSKPNNLLQPSISCLQPRHDPTSQQSQIHKPAAISGHHCLEPMPTRANHSPMKHLPRVELRFPQPFSNESQLARHLQRWDAPLRRFLFPMGSPRRSRCYRRF
ncbi:hypothetical protein BKA56DRAFT_687043 [Ilyonectria sp. MPI-CAGE-AT-0026]|nr:hypothetical protein BKA56DRAFT_687043 [Ilyonectria sp. MPI-CAGE-AT-0026]